MTDLDKMTRELLAQWHLDRGLSEKVAQDCRDGVIDIPEIYWELIRSALLTALPGWTPVGAAPAIDLEQFREAVTYFRDAYAASSLGPDSWQSAKATEANRLLALIDEQANVRSSSEHSNSLTPVAHKKLQGLQDEGFIVNGVAIFNPTTGRRGLVDYLGYVGWQTGEQATGSAHCWAGGEVMINNSNQIHSTTQKTFGDLAPGAWVVFGKDVMRVAWVLSTDNIVEVRMYRDGHISLESQVRMSASATFPVTLLDQQPTQKERTNE